MKRYLIAIIDGASPVAPIALYILILLAVTLLVTVSVTGCAQEKQPPPKPPTDLHIVDPEGARAVACAFRELANGQECPPQEKELGK